MPTCGRAVERMPGVAETPCAPPIAVVLEGCEASLTHGRLEFLCEKFCTCGEIAVSISVGGIV